jgi:hypothetical protein
MKNVAMDLYRRNGNRWVVFLLAEPRSLGMVRLQRNSLLLRSLCDLTDVRAGKPAKRRLGTPQTRYIISQKSVGLQREVILPCRC